MATATLTWVNPTARTDGTTLLPSDILSVSIFDLNSDAPAVPFAVVLGGTTTRFVTPVLAVGTYAFSVVINDQTGRSSAASNTAVAVVVATIAPPRPATNLVAVLNP